MNANTPSGKLNKSGSPGLIFKRIIRLGLCMLVLAAILFISSGHLDWVIAWVFLTVLMACMCVNMIVLILTNPEMVQERIQEEGHAKRWDEVLLSLIGVFCFVGLFLAGFDQRL